MCYMYNASCCSAVMVMPRTKAVQVTHMLHLLKDGVCCVVEEPYRVDPFCGPQVLQVHQERDSIKAQQVLCKRAQSPQVLHQLHSRSIIVNSATGVHAIKYATMTVVPLSLFPGATKCKLEEYMTMDATALNCSKHLPVIVTLSHQSYWQGC